VVDAAVCAKDVAVKRNVAIKNIIFFIAKTPYFKVSFKDTHLKDNNNSEFLLKKLT